MAYNKIKSYKMTEKQLRQLWSDTYCDHTKPIYTFDGVLVKFYDNMFDHAFYESHDWKKKDKSVLSYNRLEKMLWIKEALEDPDAIVKHGWDNRSKSYSHNSRVIIVKGDYLVVIRFIHTNVAKFVTAYQNLEEDNLNKVLKSPDWKDPDGWVKK